MRTITILNQSELARYLGVSQPYISKLTRNGVLTLVAGGYWLPQVRVDLRSNTDATRDHLSKLAGLRGYYD